MPLERLPDPFSHPDWLFEIKHDGFRALAYIRDGQVELVSRRSHTYKGFPSLGNAISEELKARDAILDGEIVSLDHNGIAQFKNLMYRRQEPRFYAFDLLWLNGKDLRERPLIERKKTLRGLIEPPGLSLLYVDYLEEYGERLFRIACNMDLEGIVAKFKHGKYTAHETTWVKIRNPRYTQIVGRDELFKKKAA